MMLEVTVAVLSFSTKGQSNLEPIKADLNTCLSRLIENRKDKTGFVSSEEVCTAPASVMENAKLLAANTHSCYSSRTAAVLGVIGSPTEAIKLAMSIAADAAVAAELRNRPAVVAIPSMQQHLEALSEGPKLGDIKEVQLKKLGANGKVSAKSTYLLVKAIPATATDGCRGAAEKELAELDDLESNPAYYGMTLAQFHRPSSERVGVLRAMFGL